MPQQSKRNIRTQRHAAFALAATAVVATWRRRAEEPHTAVPRPARATGALGTVRGIRRRFWGQLVKGASGRLGGRTRVPAVRGSDMAVIGQPLSAASSKTRGSISYDTRDVSAVEIDTV